MIHDDFRKSPIDGLFEALLQFQTLRCLTVGLFMMLDVIRAHVPSTSITAKSSQLLCLLQPPFGTVIDLHVSMASALSSQDMWRGRGRQPQTLGQPRHRSESRRLSDHRRKVKTVARKRGHCPGALHEGDPVRVFSRSADKWVDGEVVKIFEGSFVRVEYDVGGYWCVYIYKYFYIYIYIYRATNPSNR